MNDSLTAVLFDVDGTLVDTNYLHAVTWWEAFAQAGHDVAMTDIHRAIGMGSDQLLDRLLPRDRDKDQDPAIRAAHSALYSTYWSRLRPLRGATDLLRACKKRGLTVVLASSADEPEFNALRAALDAEDAIDEATFSGDVEQSKPAPDLVQVALDKAGVTPDGAVFVGDTVSGRPGQPEGRGALCRLPVRRHQPGRARGGRRGAGLRRPSRPPQPLPRRPARADSMIAASFGRIRPIVAAIMTCPAVWAAGRGAGSTYRR